MFMTQNGVFLAIKMQTKNLALAQNARIFPASSLHLRHSNSSAIPKAQKKKRQEHTSTQLGNRSSLVFEYNWSIMHYTTP